jgi:phosphoadenosine phosphosulfate reductase
MSSTPAPAPLVRTAPPALDALRAQAHGLDTSELLALAIRDWFPGRIALVSSFGAEAAVLLHLVATVDASTPVLFLDTGKLFPETLAYRDRLIAELGLRDVRSLKPSAAHLAALDPDGDLWSRDPDACCHIRKVEPLDAALSGFDAWIGGRKRHHGGERSDLQPIDVADGRVKIEPLADWGPGHIEAYLGAHGLARHPLVAQGYASIGCAPCTAPVAAGSDVRSGRWAGRGKTECGIHLPRVQA